MGKFVQCFITIRVYCKQV